MRGVKIDPLQTNFKRIVYKTAIKAKIWDPPPGNFVQKALTPHQGFWKKT
jgi:hypothetical protein